MGLRDSLSNRFANWRERRAANTAVRAQIVDKYDKEDPNTAIPFGQYRYRDRVLGRQMKQLSPDEVAKIKDPDVRRQYYEKQTSFLKGQKKMQLGSKLRSWGGEKFSKARGSWLSKKGAWQATKSGLSFSTRNIARTGMAVGQLGGAIGEAGSQSLGPIQVFTLAWRKMNVTLKWLVIIVFLVVILFVPWGIFYYAGWAVGAAFMFLVSLIYWVFVNFFNGIAYVIVSIINGIVRVIMSVVIFIVEGILDFLTDDGYKWVPDPVWASRFKPGKFTNDEGIVYTANNPWEHQGFMEFRTGFAQQVRTQYWWEGHVLLEGSLIRYDQIANIPRLMTIITPEWKDWMNNILIVKLLQWIPGAQALLNAFQALGNAMAYAFQSIVIHSDPWVVILLGLTPIFVVIGILVYIYIKYRNEAEIQSGY